LLRKPLGECFAFSFLVRTINVDIYRRAQYTTYDVVYGGLGSSS